RERREWAAQVSELLAPCPEVPVSIAQCVSENRPCKTCLPAAQLLLKQVQAGKAKKEREDAFHARFDAGKTKTLVTGGSPEMGPPDAVVTVVEWADFECPFCRAFYPVLDELVQKYPTQVRLVFKYYPLSAHPHGEISARAALAASAQGKFWPMHHLLFANQEHLAHTDLHHHPPPSRPPSSATSSSTPSASAWTSPASAPTSPPRSWPSASRRTKSRPTSWASTAPPSSSSTGATSTSRSSPPRTTSPTGSSSTSSSP